MTISAHLTHFAGFTVTLWEPGQLLGDPATTIHRLAVDYDEDVPWTDKFRAFLDAPGAAEVQGLVVGLWDGEAATGVSPEPMIEALVTAHRQLPKLRALFLNDITFEECEVSWITGGDVSPIFAAYPQLTDVGLRGGNDLSVGRLALPQLRSLIIQAGGLSAELVREVMSAELPRLEHLELYLGTDNYGATSTVADVAGLLGGTLFPRLKYLGLKNSDLQDELAQVLANAPVLDTLEVLDLSMGVLTDEGAAALLSSPRVARLKKLDVSFNWCSDEMVTRLQALPIEVDTSDQQEADEDDWRYVSLGE